MLKNKNLLLLVAGILITSFLLVPGLAEEADEKFEEPVLITSIGQSPGAMMAKVLAKKIDLDYLYDPLADSAVLEENDINTIIAVLGASGKGLGAAGIDVEDEIERVESLLEAAKEMDIPFIAMHIEGAQRRGDMSNDLINEFVPEADYLIVKQSGNDDDLFTELSEENEISLTEIDKAVDATAVLENLFSE